MKSLRVSDAALPRQRYFGHHIGWMRIEDERRASPHEVLDRIERALEGLRQRVDQKRGATDELFVDRFASALSKARAENQSSTKHEQA